MKRKLLLSLCGGLALFGLLLSRPWYAPIAVDFSAVPASATVTIILEDSWGREVRRSYAPDSRLSQVEFFSSRVVGLETDLPGPVTITLEWDGLRRPQMFDGKATVREAPTSRRWELEPLAAMVLLSAFSSCLFFLLSLEWARLRSWPTRSLLGFAVLSLSFATVAVFVVPGFFGWDIVANYNAAARYESSAFVGHFYGHLLLAGFQLVPALWLVTAANVFVTLLSLYHIYAFAIRRDQERVFYAALGLFFLYPTNLYLTYFPSRDLPAFWCFTMVLLNLYETWLDSDEHGRSQAWLVFFATCAVLLRQEALIALGPLLLFHGLRHQRARRRRLALLLGVPIGAWLLFSMPTERNQFPNAVYQATILVNPLSSILTAKYPSGLPTAVKEDLGPFFKNDYLVTHHSPYDIDPFHAGGIEQETATHEAYLQFRSAALGIIWNNPGLFLRNRLGMAQSMLGFNVGAKMYTEDGYYGDRTPAINMILESLPAQSYGRMAWFEPVYWGLEAFVSSHDKIFFQSYLVPLVLWIAFLLLFPSRSLRVLSLALLLRSLLVFATAPADYYKYQFPIWIFVPFVLIYALAERRSIRSEPAPLRSV